VLKNFPDEADARAAVEGSGPRPHALRWHAWPHYWALTYRLA